MSDQNSNDRTGGIVVRDRATGADIVEQVYGDAALRWVYGTAFGRFLATAVLSRRLPSILAGWYYGSGFSRRRVAPFIREFSIPMDEFRQEAYASFNEFFVRRFRDGARRFAARPDVLPAFAEARYLAWGRIERRQTFPVKGRYLTAAALMGENDDARRFEGGPALLARLCPVDYHRYHYPDPGTTLRSRRIPGKLHSVNPRALASRDDILCTNERRVAVLDTENFGQLAFIEIGAMNVGRIVQTHPEDRPFRRGDEKGRFLFGASSIMLLGEAGRWCPDGDLLENTSANLETLVRLGEAVAAAIPVRTTTGG